ncbi:anoctamin-8 [Egretta garzetta]|uniref:anoctamin-8 n=1 Tax=Egretta garzetta TaxID=188379 RepID=UPI00163CDAC5|nr:anoctamin-8 [Egretta garzetta]
MSLRWPLLGDTTDDHTLLWLLNHLRLGIPELIVQVRHHKHTRVYAFFVTATYESLLRGADEIGLRKPVKAEFGGGMRSFSCEEDYIYENIENELYFFTSQEWQNIIRYWLENLRAKQGESLHNIHFLEGQPINYFGVKIAMYFAWLGFYTSAMVYPAVFGSILYTFTESDQTSQDICCVVFAIFNVIWATLFLEEWKRRGAEFAYKWGTLDTPAESIEEPRPQFRGSRGEKKCLNGGCGVPEEEEEEEERRESDSEEESALDCGLKLKKVSFIEKAERRGGEPGGPEDESFLEEGSPTMVEKGMDPASVFELCEDEEEAEGPPCSPVKAVEPAVISRAGRRRRAAESREEEEGEEEGRRRNRASWIDPPEEDYSTQLTQAEVESCMKKYEDTFQDYQEMFIQFGYVVLFSSAFPLAAMCALVNNIIEIRSDAFKLCTGLQRPFGQRVESIGQWQHFALFLKYIIQVAIPDIPAWVAEEMAKLEYQRREAFKSVPGAGESSRDEAKPEVAGQDPAHEKSQSKGKGSGGSSHGSDKPKRPSSLLATNNVMKLKQIIPLQGKFLSGGAGAGSTATARSPQSPTGSENKLPGFLSFKFLKSPETKRDTGTEKVQSPTKPFNPGKLFNFGKSEGAGGNGAAATASPQLRPGPSADTGTSQRWDSPESKRGRVVPGMFMELVATRQSGTLLPVTGDASVEDLAKK